MIIILKSPAVQFVLELWSFEVNLISQQILTAHRIGPLMQTISKTIDYHAKKLRNTWKISSMILQISIAQRMSPTETDNFKTFRYHNKYHWMYLRYRRYLQQTGYRQACLSHHQIVICPYLSESTTTNAEAAMKYNRIGPLMQTI